LKNPVLVASGTFGYGNDVPDLSDVNRIGGIVTKSLSMKPRDGNPPDRIVETAGGMLNSIGLANIGVRHFISEKLPELRKYDTAIVANIAASSVDEYCDVLSLLEGEEGIHAYEINISCPNVKEGGLSFGTNPAMTAEITRRLRKLTKRPLIIKLTPNVAHVSEFARVCAGEGADGVSLINTLVGMAIDHKKWTPKLSTVTGGLSGPAIKPVALRIVYEVSQVVDIPVVAIGGVTELADVLDFLAVGAVAVQVGTAIFADPTLPVRLVDELAAECRRRGFTSYEPLIGTALPKRPSAPSSKGVEYRP